MTQNVKVVVRVRPLNEMQNSKNCKQIVQIDKKTNQIVLANPQDKQLNKLFAFDNVFAPDSTQLSIYQQTCFTLVQSVAQGYNGTVFAYGQTGCGKTHTMIGNAFDNQLKGIIPRTFEHLIQIIQNQKSKTFLLRCSFIQIYNQQIHDLLSKDIKERKQIKESSEKGVFIKNLTIPVVNGFQQMNKKLEIGFKNRSTASTLMNKDSSRSHSIFTVYIQTQEGDSFLGGKLNLVDLAGSQRQSKTQATGDRLKQAAKINLSLSALGNVICSLVDGKSTHIPYRDSKLTRLLEDSLGGNTKTIMIANISPANYNYQETLSTLRYASRAKKITNKPTVNEDPKDALLKQYAQQIQNLKRQLQGKTPLDSHNTNISVRTSQMSNKNDISKNGQQQKDALKEKIKQLEGQVMKSHNGTEDKKYKDLRSKLKKERAQRQQLIQQAKKAEEQLFQFNQNFKSVQQMSQKYKQALILVKKKYKQAVSELNDIQREHIYEKQTLTDEIRQTELERDFYEQVCLKLLTREQVQQIREKSKYDQNKMKYKVPTFLTKTKQISFPKIGEKNAEQLLKSQHQRTELSFDQNPFRIRHTKQPSNYHAAHHSGSQKFVGQENQIQRKRMKTLAQGCQKPEKQLKRPPKNVVLVPLKTQASQQFDRVKKTEASYSTKPGPNALFGFPFK